jgi:adhesin HecA-like repeat protein
METISGTHTVAITLSAHTPNVQIRGTIDAYGTLGTYAGQTIFGALFGPAGTDFHLQNKGLIESNATSANDAGIVLGSGGIVLNSGSVIGGSGILVLGAGGLVRNSKLVEGSLGAGILMAGYGSVINTGIVAGGTIGITLGAGGYVDNGGKVFGDAGIAVGGTVASYVYNTGHVLASAGDGILLDVSGVVSNTGAITASGAGVVLSSGGKMYNYGVVQGGQDGVRLQAGGIVYNRNRIKGAYGIYVKSGLGYVYNYATAQISGQTIGVKLASGGVIDNAGTIKGTLAGILLSAGTVDNEAGGVITGESIAISGISGPVIVHNAGYVHETATLGSEFYGEPTSLGAIVLLSGGTIDNSGTINGYRYAIFVSGGPANVDNSGLIDVRLSTRYSTGVELRTTGTVTNTGTISAATGVVMYAGGVLLNSGSILGGTKLEGGTLYNSGLLYGGNNAPEGIQNDRTTVYLLDGANLMNSSTLKATFGNAVIARGRSTIVNTGLITSNFYSKYYTGGTAIDLADGVTLVNKGTILGGGLAISIAGGGTVINDGTISHDVIFGTSANNLMVMAPTAAIIGQGTLYGGGGTLELAAGPAIGTVSPFTSFATILIDPGATWHFDGNTNLGATIAVTNEGTLKENAAAHFTIAGSLDGSGTIVMANQGLDLGGPVAAGQKVRFTGAAETLTLGDAGSFAGTIAGFTTGETIVLDGISKDDVFGFAFSSGTLTVAAAGETVHLALAGSFGASTFHDFKVGKALGITLTGSPAMQFETPALSFPAPDLPALTINHANISKPALSPAVALTASSGWLGRDWPETAPPILSVLTLQN